VIGNIKLLLAALRQELSGIYHARLKGIYLFGSYARGDFHPESDVDILIVLSNFDQYGIEIDRTSGIASELSLKYNISISMVFIREMDWINADTPLLRNARQEAIPA
jgi:predicted nucleotidyltransferase